MNTLNQSSKLKLLWPVIIIFSLALIFIFFYQFFMGYLTWVFPVNDRQLPSQNEAVMTPGMQISLHNSFGPIIIKAGNGLKRFFIFDGQTRSIEMHPRIKPYYGNYGLYFAGPGFHWLPVNGIVRCVTIEGDLNFASLGEALNWLKQKPAEIARMYRNDGLSVWISKRDGTLGVDIFQIYINGRKPQKLDGADDQSIQVNAVTPIPNTTKTALFDPSFVEDMNP